MDTFPAVQAYIGWKKALNFAHIDDPQCRPSDCSALATFSAYHEWWVNRPRLARRQRRGGTARASAGDAPAMAAALPPAVAGDDVVAISDGDDNEGDNLALQGDTALPTDGLMVSVGGGDEGDCDDGDGDDIGFDDSFGGGIAGGDPRAAVRNECSIEEDTAGGGIRFSALSPCAVGAEQQRPSKRQRVESEDTGGGLETPVRRTGCFNDFEASNAEPRPTSAVSVSALSEEQEEDDDDEEFFDAESGDDGCVLNANR
jgi:hypothetical protein